MKIFARESLLVAERQIGLHVRHHTLVQLIVRGPGRNIILPWVRRRRFLDLRDQRKSGSMHCIMRLREMVQSRAVAKRGIAARSGSPGAARIARAAGARAVTKKS
jgi:hypothetical protein